MSHSGHFPIHAIKCIKCPYRLGTIKCVINPCIECLEQKRKTHPFPTPVEIHENVICKKCGSNTFKDGKCAICGSKVKGCSFFR